MQEWLERGRGGETPSVGKGEVLATKAGAQKLPVPPKCRLVPEGKEATAHVLGGPQGLKDDKARKILKWKI